MGEYDLAEQAFLDTWQIQQSDRDYHQDRSIARTLINLGNVYFVSGHYADATDLYEKALDIAQTQGLFRLESIALGNLGSVLGSLGNNDRAIAFHNQQLEVASRIGDADSMANALGNLGNTYGAQENYQQSIALYQQQLQQARNSNNDILEAIALNNLGQIYRKLLQYPKAISSYQEAQQIVQRQGNRQGEAVIVLGLGQIFHDSGQYFEALKHYQKAFQLHQNLGNLPAERDVAAEIGQLLDAQGHPALAIIFYKHAVNTSEIIRQDIRTLPLIVQQNYTDEVLSNTYRALADLLLQQDRILEAQRVLDLLKVQELQDYLGPVRGNENTTTGIDYHRPERRILNLYDEAIALGLELDQLRQIDGRDRTTIQQARLNELVTIEQDIINSFFDFVDSPEIVDLVNQLSRTARRQNLDLEQLNALRNDLKQLEQNAVLFYPLILEDRLELILVTPYSAPIRRTVSVSREVFNQAILEFRQELTQPFGQEFSAAQQLYDWMIAPLEEDLMTAGAETLLYAPDGQLRYIPLTALRNGDQWLVEQYRVNNITAASLTNFASRPKPDLKVLAAAFKDSDSRYNFSIGQRSFALSGLPFAGLEVEAIANGIPDTTVLLDPEFNRAQTVPQMNDHNIVHLATHAGFVPGTPEESFILFGDGDRATLRDVATWSLSNVDLVVLSACQTAVGNILGNGEEILGFGYQIQRTGARAAIASLWTVDDGGTQILMSLFYSILSTGNITKAEALQQAQIAMLTGDLSRLDVAPSQLAQSINLYRHPRYWSPFILIGNGL